jgi:lipopolysaccharide/colanic/teichoic acid biosynthesis glycosyltransferase
MGERTRELLLLLCGDMVVFMSALWVTLLVRYFSLPSVEVLADHFGPFLILSCIWIVIFFIGGLYDKHTIFLKSLLFTRILNIQIINIALAAILFFIIPFGITPKTNLVIYLVISIGMITVWRLYFFNFFSPKLKHRAMLLADGPEAIQLIEEINNNDRYNYTFVRLVDKAAAEETPDLKEKLLKLVRKERISIIVANPHSPYLDDILPSLFDLAFLNFELTFLDFYKVYEDTFDRIPLSALRYEWFLNHVSQSKNPVYDFVKRIIDIAGSVLIGCVLVLCLPFIYIAMRIEGPGPVFITQERLGQANKRVTVYKIRTMTENRSASATWTPEDAAQGNRITRVGSLLRKLSIDELPQVWTILKGEMSLIGPRNDIIGLGERLAKEIPYYNIRNFVKPGVTGWAQTNQHYQAGNISPQSIEESRIRLAYDLYYVKNRSVWLDITIAIRTIKTVISRFGIGVSL